MCELIENLLSIDEANAALNALRPDRNEIEYGQYYALTNDDQFLKIKSIIFDGHQLLKN